MVLMATMFLYSLALSFSPGPVNMVIISSGVMHGFRKTFAFVSGATLGSPCCLSLLVLGYTQSLPRTHHFSNT